jgi:F-type H+-transporting ATPase subunit b
MSLITPDFGLLFWMTVIFGIVFFLLAKFGFPVITGMVSKRQQRIDNSIASAKVIEERLSSLEEEQKRILAEARKQQSDILSEAAKTKDKIIEDAKSKAGEEAGKIISEARVQIEAEKESAMRDIRKEVAVLSVGIAEKILRRELSTDESLDGYMQTLLDDIDGEHLTVN